MLQHETGHLDGLLYLDIPAGGPPCPRGEAHGESNGWGVRPCPWMPAECRIRSATEQSGDGPAPNSRDRRPGESAVPAPPGLRAADGRRDRTACGGRARVRVRAADGAVHEFRHTDVLYVRQLTDRR